MVWLSVAALGTVAGCGRDDPLETFKQNIGTRCIAELSKVRDETGVQLDGKGWGRNLYLPQPATFDVKRTDSLVSPFVAVIESRVTTTYAFADTKEKVLAIQLPRDAGEYASSKFRVQLHYAFQDNTWRSTNVEFTGGPDEKPPIYESNKSAADYFKGEPNEEIRAACWAR